MLSDRLRVCALVPYPTGTTPSQRFRIEQWLPALDRNGIAVDILPFMDEDLQRLLLGSGRTGTKLIKGIGAFLRRPREVLASRNYDAVLIHRAICVGGPGILEYLLAALGRPILYDFDDAIFLPNTSEANKWFGWMKFPGKTATICRLSSHIVAGNTFLADYARRYNQSVTVIPTSIDTNHYRPIERNGRNGSLIVGWTGSSTSQTHLELFAPVLGELLRKERVELRVISNREPELPGLKYDWRPWRPETEVQEIGQFDIGIMPMPEDRWSRGKCALKALQYMSMGIPTICSAVGANVELIDHGKNGLLASTPQEWMTNLTALIEDSPTRARLGAAGRQTVEASYSTERCAGLFAGVVRSSVAKGKSSK